MMGLSTVLSPSPQEILEAAKKIATVPSARKYLADATDALDQLAERQTEITAMAQKVDADRKALDKHAAELNEDNARKTASLDAREAALQARVAKFEAAVARFDQGLAAHEDELGASPP
jgi:Skp family chaperone for outer membrane proteins